MRSKSKVFERIVEVAEKIRKEKGIGIKDGVEVVRCRLLAEVAQGVTGRGEQTKK